MATYSLYTVRKGDTLTKIAKQFGTTVASIAKINNIANANKIRIGDTLSILVTEKTPVIDTAPIDPIFNEGSVTNPISALLPVAKAGGWFEPPKLYYLLGAAALLIFATNR